MVDERGAGEEGEAVSVTVPFASQGVIFSKVQ